MFKLKTLISSMLYQISSLSSLLFFTTCAFADAGESPVGNGLQWLVDQMLGKIGLALATLVIIATGLLCYTHMMEWKRLPQVVIGTAIIFGAPALALAIKNIVMS